MSEKRNIDDAVRRKMENFSKVPPPEIWENILSDISAGKKRKILPVFWRYAAGIAVLLALGTIFILTEQSEKIKPSLHTELKNSEKPPFDHPEEIVRDENSQTTVSDKKNRDEVIKSGADNNLNGSKTINNIQTSLKHSGYSVSVDESNTMVNPAEDTNISYTREYLAPTPILSDLPEQYKLSDIYDTAIFRKKFAREYAWSDLTPDELPKDGKKKKEIFSIAAIASPVYTYRDLGNIEYSVNEYFNNSESGKISYSGGINFGVKAGKRLSFHSGIIYSKMGLSVNNILAVAEVSDRITEDAGLHFDASSPYILSNSIGSIKRSEMWQTDYEYTSLNSSENRVNKESGMNYLSPEGFYDLAANYVEDDGRIDQFFEYLEIPFLVKYTFIDRKLDLKVLGGMSTNFLIDNDVFYKLDKQSTRLGSTSDIQKVNYSGNIGLGLDYDIRKRLKFILEPQFKYYLNSINSDELIRNRPYSFGLYTGFLYAF